MSDLDAGVVNDMYQQEFGGTVPSNFLNFTLIGLSPSESRILGSLKY